MYFLLPFSATHTKKEFGRQKQVSKWHFKNSDDSWMAFCCTPLYKTFLSCSRLTAAMKTACFYLGKLYQTSTTRRCSLTPQLVSFTSSALILLPWSHPGKQETHTHSRVDKQPHTQPVWVWYKAQCCIRSSVRRVKGSWHVRDVWNYRGTEDVRSDLPHRHMVVKEVTNTPLQKSCFQRVQLIKIKNVH